MLKLEERLKRKATRCALKNLRRKDVDDVFERCLYLFPQNFKVVNYPRKPVASFNPAVISCENEGVRIFPRLIFEYYTYVSSIGITKEVPIEKLIKGKIRSLDAQVVLHPTFLWEILGCEDPRTQIVGGQMFILYTGKGLVHEKRRKERKDVLALANLDRSFNVKRKGFFKISWDGEEFTPQSNKDAAFLKVSRDKASMLVRPEIGGKRICWRCEASLSNLTLDGKTLEPVMANEPWEEKVGWSTNAVKLSSNEYLVGWHGVLREEESYKNGLAVVDDEGGLLAVSDYLLSPRSLPEMYGDKPLTIFGCGLMLYKEYLIWVGGISDYGIAIFRADLEKVLERVRWIR
ncbi:hypothetical protein J7L06_10760 [Candidatus Bathyarchaeota archaeon]|nr:hypothetical protein [Candidatus Bathyarchaeota archaeon]